MMVLTLENLGIFLTLEGGENLTLEGNEPPGVNRRHKFIAVQM
jgi:hypothetical protein